MPKNHRFDHNTFRVEYQEKLNLEKIPSQAGKELKDKQFGAETLAADVSSLQAAQSLLYAAQSHSMLIILQGMDAAGKDSTIRHVMGGVNPQGCRVYAFKAPNDEELQHHFLYRPVPCLPARGMISLFNRSYYEETLVVRVHPEFLVPQKIPDINIEKPKSLKKLWNRRFKEINAFERTLTSNGTIIVKFFLHVSRQEQKKRLLDRLTEPDKHWKFNRRDLEERKLWPDYQRAFEETLTNTSTEYAPWYVIPADDKWYARAAIADILASRLESLDLQYPEVKPADREMLREIAAQLQAE
ncbi:MAG: polyphosphate kinase 2 family protein [Planctomycetales bacterium]|nr:polyphosphate kinase 2 family protein [Planctomycetales bacterium]